MVMDETSFISVVMGFSVIGFSEYGFSEDGFSEDGFSVIGFSEGGFSEYRFSAMDESTGKNSLISIVIGSDIIIYQRTFIHKKEGVIGETTFPLKLKLNKQNKQKVLNKTINPFIKC